MTSALLLCDDLFVASQVTTQCHEAGITLTPLPRGQDLVQQLATLDPRLLLIDLTASDAMLTLESLETLRRQQPALQVVAFGPHVQTGRLQAARQAGCDLVLSRGQMLRKGAAHLARLVG